VHAGPGVDGDAVAVLMSAHLAERAAELERARVPFAYATVVRAQHPTSAHAGDTAIVHADGTIDGFVGGTCAEESVRLYGMRVLQTGEPVLLRVRPGDPSTVEEDGAVTVANPCVSGGALEIFLQPRRPAPRVLVLGDTPVAAALAELAGPVGFSAEPAGPALAPAPDDAGLVVASHGRGEKEALEAGLRAGVPYVALVGSRIRAASVLASLDVPDADRARVRSPAGLDIGARTAGEIALSILAELVSERARPRVPLPAAPAARAEPATRAEPAARADLEEARGDTPRTAAHNLKIGGGGAGGAGGEGAGGGVGEPWGGGPATAVDPVCGMFVVITPTALSTVVGGRTAYFCGEHCRASFVADPERYATAP
jgi:xanthine dehydrogenase accessory factor